MDGLDNFVMIDGHHLLFRMFYGMQTKIRSKDGVLINAVLGFISSIIKYIKLYEPEYFLVIFDSEKPNYRSELDKAYKGNRQLDFSNVCNDENPFFQLVIIKELLNRLAIKHCEIDGFEADDVIASYVSNMLGMKKHIISGDSDLLQLVDQQTVVFMDRGKKSITYDENRVLDKFGILPSKIVDYKALTGDKADHICGLAGVGPKTAVRLLQQFGCIERMLTAADKITPPGLRERIESGKAVLRKNKYLISLRNDAPLKFALSDLAIDHTDFLEKKAIDVLRANQYI